MKSVFYSAREYFQPLLSQSKFKESGVLTPQEFITAGDLLIKKCQCWEWSSGSIIKNYLPIEKQYLIQRNVKCVHRVQELINSNSTETIADDFIITHEKHKTQDITDLDDTSNTFSTMADINAIDIPDIDAMETFGIDTDNDVSKLDPILQTRTYNISITYDKYYQTPRLWLVGFDEHSRILSSEQIFQDISHEHAKKTCTIEKHPHEDITCAGIHPCQHANVMKLIINEIDDVRVDQYLFIFLKFISTILPTLEYDYV